VTDSILHDRVRRLEYVLATKGIGSLNSSTVVAPINLALTQQNHQTTDGNTFCKLTASWALPSAGHGAPIRPSYFAVALDEDVQTVPAFKTSVTWSNLMPGREVTVSVFSVAADGTASDPAVASIVLSDDVEPPDAPTNFRAEGAFRAINLYWTNPTSSDFDHIEIWESPVGEFDLSTRIATTTATDYCVSEVGVMEVRFYWIRAIDRTGNGSEFIGPVSALTSPLRAEDVPEGLISPSMLAPILSDNLVSLLDGVIGEDNGLEELAETQLRSALLNHLNFLYQLEVRDTQELADETALQEMLDGFKRYQVTFAAIREESRIRAEENEALAEKTLQLEAVANDNHARIMDVKRVWSGQVQVYDQPTAPYDNLSFGDIWIDADRLIHRWNGISWVAMPEAAVENLEQLKDFAYGLWTLQTDVNGHVIGIGSYNDGETGEVAIRADRFYVIRPRIVYDSEGNVVKDFGTYGQNQIFAIDTQTGDLILQGNLLVKALQEEGYADTTGWIRGDKIASNSLIQLADGGRFIMGNQSHLQIGTAPNQCAYLSPSGATFVNGKFSFVESNPTTGQKTTPFIYDRGVLYLDEAMIKNASITTAKIKDAAITRAKIGYAEIDKLRIKDYELSEFISDTRTNEIDPTTVSGASDASTTVYGVNSTTAFCVSGYPIHHIWVGLLYNHEVNIDARIRYKPSSRSYYSQASWQQISTRGWNDFGASCTMVFLFTPTSTEYWDFSIDLRFYDKDNSWGSSRIKRRTLVSQSIFR
jgi:hypothetical protein